MQTIHLSHGKNACQSNSKYACPKYGQVSSQLIGYENCGTRVDQSNSIYVDFGLCCNCFSLEQLLDDYFA